MADAPHPRLCLLGGLTVASGIGSVALAGTQPRLVLGFLALERHRPVARDELADLLWPASMPSHWSGALRGVISHVRRFLGTAGAGTGSSVRFDHGLYHLELAPSLEIDVEIARRCFDEAEARLAKSDIAGALGPATTAAGLLGSPLLAADGCPWLDDQRQHLQFQRIRALHIRSIALAGVGQFAGSIEASEEAVAVDHLDEGSHQAAIAAHLAAGSPAGALRAYERCRSVLANELGCRPGPGTEALYRRALNEQTAPRPIEVRSDAGDGAAPTSGSAPARTADAVLAASVAGQILDDGAPPEGDAWRARMRAGDQAMADLDYSGAAACYERALHHAAGAGPHDRARLQAALGAALRRAGRFAAARSTLRAALVAGRDAGDAEAVALVVLDLVGGGGRGVSPDLDDGARAALLADALAGLGAGPIGLRIQVMAELSLALLLVDPNRSRVIAVAADDLVRVSGHPSDAARAMVASRLIAMLPVDADRRLAAVDAVLAAPGHELTSEVLARMLLWRQYDLAELGDRVGFDRNLAILRELVERLGQPYWQWVAAGWSVTEAVIDGAFDEALVRATASLDVMSATDHPEVADAWSAHLLGIEVALDRAGPLVDAVRAASVAHPSIPTYRAATALALAQGGRLDEASEVLDQFRGPGGVDIVRDTNWSGTVATLAAAAHLVGHVDLAEELAVQLEPHAERMVVLSLYGGGALFFGPVALHLGRLQALLGQTDSARHHLRSAEARAEAFGAVTYRDQARVALRRLDHPGR